MEHVPDLPAGIIVLKFPSHPVKFLKQAEYRHAKIITSDFDQILMRRR